MNKMILFIVLNLFCSASWAADEKKQVLLYDPMAYPMIIQPEASHTAVAPPKAKAVEPNVFESTVKDAIRTLENSIRKTCTREMETSISVTAEGKWAVVGVAITGAMRLVILNPEMSKNCSK